MPAATFDPASARHSLFGALVDAARRNGRRSIILEDPERSPLTYDRLLIACMALGRKLAVGTERGERVGVMLPSIQAAVVTMFGLSARGRVPAMLNFTAGIKNLRSACETGEVRTIVTARRFVEQAKLDEVIEALREGGRRIVYLEDVRASLTSLDKLIAVAESRVPGLVHSRYGVRPDDPAVILFTSGTEGQPKGVVLTGANLASNALQIGAHAVGALTRADILFNPLPIFHAFGLTAGLLVGLLNGMKVVLYPSPLHAKQVPKLIGETGATILFSTDTFLQSYARAADPGDLTRVRYVIAGAERVKDATRALWDAFGATILEGYGATECSPIISVNLPEQHKPGSVGRLLPAIETRIEPVAGISEGGRLSVRGPNVMAGILHHGGPGAIEPPPGGWHDTGDIVDIDADGYLFIKGRAKRFAKIGGEMISLAALDALAADLWPEHQHVVVSLPDPRKGEQLVLVTDKLGAERDALRAHAKAQGFSELWAPRAVLVVETVPLLGSGKIDFVAAGEMAQAARVEP